MRYLPARRSLWSPATTLNWKKWHRRETRRAAKLFRLTEQPSRFLATIQVVITLSGFLGSAFAAENFSDRIVSALVDAGMKIPEKTLDAIAVVLITLLLSYITLIFRRTGAEKRLAMQKAEQIALGDFRSCKRCFESVCTACVAADCIDKRYPAPSGDRSE